MFGIGVGLEDVCVVAQSLRCTMETLPFVYLGLLVRSNMGHMKSWDPVVEKWKRGSWDGK